ncbi:uncharacterized protein AAEQ78_025030 [Lycaon pictus]
MKSGTDWRVASTSQEAPKIAGKRQRLGAVEGRRTELGVRGGEGACLQQPELTALFAPAQVNVSFSLSLELLSYQKLPADQMLPGVDIRQHASGEKEMVFTQSLLLEYANHTTQVVPLRATVAVPELQLSTSWVDFGTCFVNQERVREVYLMNLSGCRSYWAVLMGRLGLPPTSRAGWHLVGGPAEKAGSQIPSDPRVALPRGPGPDPRCTPGIQGGAGGSLGGA